MRSPNRQEGEANFRRVISRHDHSHKNEASAVGPVRVKTRSVLWPPVLNRRGMMRVCSRGGSPADDAVTRMP
jgi:hypothetical protein